MNKQFELRVICKMIVVGSSEGVFIDYSSGTSVAESSVGVFIDYSSGTSVVCEAVRHLSSFLGQLSCL